MTATVEEPDDNTNDANYNTSKSPTTEDFSDNTNDAKTDDKADADKTT